MVILEFHGLTCMFYVIIIESPLKIQKYDGYRDGHDKQIIGSMLIMFGKWSN